MKKLIFLTLILACNKSPTEVNTTPAKKSCSLVIEGEGFKIAPHYPICPAEAGATEFTFMGYTYKVIWDR